MKLTKKRIFVLFGLIVFALIVAAWSVIQKLESDIHTRVGHYLTSQLNTTHQGVTSWLDEHQATARIWANTPEVRSAALTLLAGSGDRRALMDSPVQTRLRAWLHPVYTAKGYQGYFIISAEHINLASRRDQNIGQKNLLITQESFFRKIWSGDTAISLPQKSDVPLPDINGNLREGLPTMFVGAPVVDDAGKVVAAFTFRINPADDFTSILQQGRAGNSGETYAFSKQGLLISNSRFSDQLRDIGLLERNEEAILNIQIRNPGVNLIQGEENALPEDQRPLTLMASKAVAGQSGLNLDGYRDYRGVPVVGAWRWDDDLGIGFTTEMDVAEAYEAFHATSYTITSLTLLIFLLLTWVITFQMVSRQRRQAEMAQQKSEQLYRHLFENAGVGIVLTGQDGKFLQVNDYFCQFIGYEPEELRQMTPLDITHPEDLVETNEKFGKKNAGKLDSFNLEKRYFHKDGSIRWGYVTASMVRDHRGTILASMATIVDITRRKEAEKALQRSEVLEQLATGATLREILTSLVSNAEKLNPEILCSILLLDEDGKHLRHGAAPSLPKFYNEAIDGIEIGPAIGSCGKAAFTCQRIVIEDVMADPNWINFREHAKNAGLRACWSEPVFSSTGAILGTFAIYYREPRAPSQLDLDFIQDSARLAGIAIEGKQAEIALRESEECYRRLVEGIGEEFLIMTTTVDGIVEYVSPFIEKFSRFTCEEAVGRHWKELADFTDETITRAAARDAEMASSCEYLPPFEETYTHPDGSLRTLEVFHSPVFDVNGKVTHIHSVIRDITERRRAEEKTLELLQQNRHLTQRLFEAHEEERRYLARELHDEFGQWLTVIQLQAQIVSRLKPGKDPQIQSAISTIKDSATHIHKGVRGIINTLRPTMIDELGLVESLRELVKNWQLHNPDIRCELSIGDTLDNLVDTTEITIYRVVQEALTNVAKYANASHIRVGLQRESPGPAGFEYLVLSVEDNGVGMDMTQSSEGMGLVGMRERVISADGDFCIHSKVGKGTSIRATFPVKIKHGEVKSCEPAGVLEDK